MDIKYAVSIIVPIYNMEKYIDNCMASLIKQTIGMDKMEVLLIDDGSEDSSKAICQTYADKYESVKLFSKPNEGLSRTRNFGLDRATGKYILYLDPDDTLTPETVKSVTDFFDEHYDEVDLVTYQIVPIVAGKKSGLHYRYRTLVQSGVYDLTKFENAFISQTNINICVKNNFENNIKFSVEPDFRHEDQKYSIDILLDKMKIGYCQNGKYLYLHQPESIVRTYFYAYYIFEKTTLFWENIFNHYSDCKVPVYLQGLYLNDLNWKMRSDILFPYHYEDEAYTAAINRLVSMLERVDDEIILAHPGINNFHRHYFINLKPHNDFRHYVGFNEYVITNHQHVIFEAKKIEVVLTKYKIRGDNLEFTGFLKSSLFNYIDKPRLTMVTSHGKTRREIPLSESSWSYYQTKVKTNQFWLFRVDIDISSDCNFSFKVMLDNNIFDTYLFLMPDSPFNKKLQRNVYYVNGKEHKLLNDKFYVTQVDKTVIDEHHQKTQKIYYKKNIKLWFSRKMVLEKQRKNQRIWLYYDCKGVKRDNGYYQFVHDFYKNDSIKRYYIVNDDFSFVADQFDAKQMKHLVRFGSNKHKLLYLCAEKIITAFVEKNNYCPFDNAMYPYYVDICSMPDIVYLQHGVLHAHLPWKYSLDRLGIDKTVVSTNFEVQNMTQNYNYRESDLIQCGMPRYDLINASDHGGNRILFAPSWRKYLVGMQGAEWISTEAKFLNSEFFAKTNEFLNSEKLDTMLTDYDFVLEFKLHPILERYKHLYKISSSRVKLVEKTVNETAYKVFMTDFSSFVFDFAYLSRPIIYFVPDYEMFVSGMNDYRALDMPFNDGLGDFVTTAQDAATALEDILQQDCNPKNKYMDKMQKLFIHKDNHQCDRLYDALLAMPSIKGEI